MLRPLIFALVASALWLVYQDVSAYMGVETLDKPFVETLQNKVDERKAKAAREQYAKQAMAKSTTDCTVTETCAN